MTMESKDSDEIRRLLNDVLTKNGEGDRLKETLTKLLNDCGWKDEVNMMCRQVIHDKGVDNITAEDIVKEVTPQARAKVPAEVKQVLLEKIKSALLKELDNQQKENGN